jgi:hypothetical protein
MNSDKFRERHNTPSVELAPLPSGAQFLNVIESVFSGMSRAILHNSNYGSVRECKAADLRPDFHELAESTAAHDFNGFMQLITSEALGQRQTQQQQQQIQPEKKDD